MSETAEKVKLTVEVPKALWRAAKLRAVETDSDLRTIVIRALESYLAGQHKAGEKR
jgi:hypothetical protein